MGGIYIPNNEKPIFCDVCFVPLSKCEYFAKNGIDHCPIVEIVTCRECNRSATDDGGNTFCMWLGALRKPTDFCSYGERKGTGVKEAITQLEIIATNMVGRLAETHDEKEAKIISKQIEAIDMGINALKHIRPPLVLYDKPITTVAETEVE